MSKAGNRFGEIAVREGFASRGAVRDCLEIQNKLKSFGVEPKRLGEIMIEKGFLREEDVRAILDVQRLGGSRMESRSGVTDVARSRSRRGGGNSVSGDHLKLAVKSLPGYEVLELLGEGGMGVVYKARQKSLDRIVALKVLPPHAAKEASFIKRFIAEARTVAKLNHENIIAGIDVGEADGTYYFAMEHVEGDSAADLIERQGSLEERFALQITAQMAKALEHAHKHGLVHRDVKPQNILVTRNNLAKLCDLGLAKMQSEAGVDPAGIPIGTPNYLSPEQARGQADVDIRSDIYSLGATLYHMLSGRTPFEGQSPMVLLTKHLTEEPPSLRKANPQVSRGAADLVARMMSKEKEDRHQTPTELLEDVERVLAGRPTSGGGSRRGSRRSGKGRKSGKVSRPSPVVEARESSRESSRDGGRRPEAALERRARARRGALIRGGRGNETILLLLIPLMLIAVVAGVIFTSYNTPSFESPDPVAPATHAEAEQALKEARRLHVSDPAGARQGYQAVVERYPGTRAAELAADYLKDLGG